MRGRIHIQHVLGVLIILILLAGGWVRQRTRDRHPGYVLDLHVPAPATPGPLRAGFAAVPITPQVVDTWTDVNDDARYQPKDGDTYDDRNGNGRFDPYWLAGYHAGRPATGVHDDLWARAMVLDDGQTRVAIVVLDAIGFMHDDVLEVRRQIAARAEVDYTIVCSTHTHEAPDLLGLWGRTFTSGGVNPQYLGLVRARTADAVVQAVAALEPATLRFAQALDAAHDLLGDGRDPQVFDPGIRLIQAVAPDTGRTLGVLFAWANHPETLGSHNLEITSDFPHYVRESLEQGVYDGEREVVPGLGGIAVYVNGAIGGLLSTGSSVTITDPVTGEAYAEATFLKAQAQGRRLAMLGMEALRGDGVVEVSDAGIRLRARTIELPLGNRLWRLGVVLRLFERGYTRWGYLRTEIASVHVGPAQFMAVPGEIYPEIVNGGIEAPAGRDFAVAPMEVPPLRDLMTGEFQFVLGLANDEIGYIIPKSEWDTKAPFLYEAEESPYGEINSPGPETGPVIYDALATLLREP